MSVKYYIIIYHYYNYYCNLSPPLHRVSVCEQSATSCRLPTPKTILHVCTVQRFSTEIKSLCMRFSSQRFMRLGTSTYYKWVPMCRYTWLVVHAHTSRGIRPTRNFQIGTLTSAILYYIMCHADIFAHTLSDNK